ncbi:hypothetical protein ACJJTC_017748 [Scirpophaga incertulas]
MRLAHLYDKLSSYLHALESLGITTDKNATMLLPMVESAISIELLKAWERSCNKNKKPNLKNLIEYVKAEVESEGRIKITRDSKEPTATCILANIKKKDERNITALFVL